MRVLISGGQGQLGEALERRAHEAFGRRFEVLAAGRETLDLLDPAAPQRIVDLAPDVVVNAAAMTNVDGCEDDPMLAYAINADGAGRVAEGARLSGARLVHISTDFVFSGGLGRPYLEDDRPDPTSVYGASKLAGEEAVRASGANAVVVRTAWLYGLAGHHFVTKILRRAAEQASLEIITTEVGNPTFCDDLADALLQLVDVEAEGILHLTNEGYVSRFAFAKAILALAGRPDFPVHPVEAFPRKACPPSFAPLANQRAAALGLRLPPWQDALERYFSRREAFAPPAAMAAARS